MVLVQGCASLTASNEQTVQVETFDATGVEVRGAACSVLKGSASLQFTSPAAVSFARDAADIAMDCVKDGYPQANGRLVSRANVNTFGNILLGGLIGVVVDQATGKAYNYPTWVRLVFGKSLIFDRSEQQDNQPSLGKAAPPPAAAQSPPPTTNPAPAPDTTGASGAPAKPSP